jgi:RNA polymerase sigma-70 factor (ECF subfamily)
MSGPGFDLSAALNYSVPGEAAKVAHPEFDYGVLVKPMEGRMMRTIWRIVREREAAEDALQEALATIWKKRDAVARHPKPEALILRIAVSAAIDALRKSRRRLRHEMSGLPDDRAGDIATPFTEEVEGREFKASILKALQRLSKRQATAVLLRIVEEQSYEDVAKAMGCSESTARVSVMRGRARLARLLAPRFPGLAVSSGRTQKEAAS